MANTLLNIRVQANKKNFDNKVDDLLKDLNIGKEK